MSMTLTSDQQSVVSQLAASGRYSDEGQVVDEALELLRQRDDLRARLGVGIDQLDRGERLPICAAPVESKATQPGPPCGVFGGVSTSTGPSSGAILSMNKSLFTN